MPKDRKKKRRTGKRQIETALPKKQYKRTNRMLFAFSVVLLIVFGGGAGLLAAGVPQGIAARANPTPVVAQPQAPGSADQGQQFSTTPTPAAPTATPAP